VWVDGAVQGGADADAVAEEEGIDYSEDEPDRAGDYGAGLKLKGGRQDELWRWY
jgi:hypothetical protein